MTDMHTYILYLSEKTGCKFNEILYL